MFSGLMIIVTPLIMYHINRLMLIITMILWLMIFMFTKLWLNQVFHLRCPQDSVLLPLCNTPNSKKYQTCSFSRFAYTTNEANPRPVVWTMDYRYCLWLATSTCSKFFLESHDLRSDLRIVGGTMVHGLGLWIMASQTQSLTYMTPSKIKCRSGQPLASSYFK